MPEPDDSQPVDLSHPDLQDAVRWAVDGDEEDIADSLAADYSDEDSLVEGGAVLARRLVRGRRRGRNIQVACELDVAYAPKNDDPITQEVHVAGTCWYILEFAETDDGLEIERSWIRPYRSSSIPWPAE